MDLDLDPKSSLDEMTGADVVDGRRSLVEGLSKKWLEWERERARVREPVHALDTSFSPSSIFRELEDALKTALLDELDRDR